MTRTTNARLAGCTLLLYIVIGITQMILGGVTSANGTAARLALFAEHAVRVRINLLLSLPICVTAVVLAVALYGITRDEDHELAVLALMFRVGEGLLGAAAPIATLGVLWLAAASPTGAPEPAAITLGGFLLKLRVWNTLVGATLFAVGSTLFAWLLLRGRMIPIPLAWLGVAASILLVVGLPLQLAGFLTGPVTQFMWLPMARLRNSARRLAARERRSTDEIPHVSVLMMQAPNSAWTSQPGWDAGRCQRPDWAVKRCTPRAEAPAPGRVC